LDVIFSIITDEELKDIDFCKRLIERALREKNTPIISLFFEKITPLFVFNYLAFRKRARYS
jgi:hypothetical protein